MNNSNTDTINEKIISDGVVVLKTNITSIGNEKPANIELNETYLVINSAIMKIPIHINVVVGSIARTKPNRVATPLPPLKPT